MTSLLKPPPEIHLMITSRLKSIDRACLRLTNRYFYKAIPCPKARALTSIEYQINKHSSDPKVLQCNKCKRIRPLAKFADKAYEIFALKTKPDILKIRPAGLTWESFCIECCVQEGKSGCGAGEVVVVEDQYHVICMKCLRCEPMRSTQRPALCQQCVQEAERLRERRIKEEMKEMQRRNWFPIYRK